jgi:hypothetical protein
MSLFSAMGFRFLLQRKGAVFEKKIAIGCNF